MKLSNAISSTGIGALSAPVLQEALPTGSPAGSVRAASGGGVLEPSGEVAACTVKWPVSINGMVGQR